MRALEQRPNPRNFSEKLMFLVNRGGELSWVSFLHGARELWINFCFAEEQIMHFTILVHCSGHTHVAGFHLGGGGGGGGGIRPPLLKSRPPLEVRLPIIFFKVCSTKLTVYDYC